VSVAESIAGFEGDGMALRGWILTIGYRRLVDEFRRQGRRLDDPVEIPEISHDVTPEDVVMSRVGWAQRLLSQLPAQQADVVMLRVIGGLSVDAVATATGLTRANVRVLSHRGLARLQDLVARDPEAAASENVRPDVTEPNPRAMY
jgi:RNA polymerase sigma-70 factor (ECF subfamily)